MGAIADFVKAHGQIGVGDSGSVVAAIQSALFDAGHILIIDSEFGNKTKDAVRAFQAARKLEPVGYVGPKTAAALDKVKTPAKPSEDQKNAPATSLASWAPHLATMRAITGTKEVPGSANSPIIMAWRGVIAERFPKQASYAKGYTGDAIPWCGYTVAYCLAVNGLEPVFGNTDTKRWMWADAWGHECAQLIVVKPFIGAILTFTRAGGGHVAICEGERSDAYLIRGGNQSDMVSQVWKSKAQFSAATWPRGLPLPHVMSMDMSKIVAPKAGSEA